MNETRSLAEFCRNIEYKDLPHEAIDRARFLTLNFLGIAARGSLSEPSIAIRSFIKDSRIASNGCVLIGTNIRTIPVYAALANGIAGHSLELDDLHNESSSHIGAVVIPVALAISELTKCDERRFIEALVVGYEVMARVGIALNPIGHYARGFHPTGTCGAFGAAVTASRILGLDFKQMVNALGIAGSTAAGLMEFLADGTWTKVMHPGWAAHSGIMAAFLAKNGFRGPSTIIEGKSGFLNAYSENSDPSKLLDGLGDSYQITKTSVKVHACCRYEQGSIDGILKIMRDNDLQARDIEKIALGILKAGFSIVAEPKENKLNPQNLTDAQFSMPFGAALAVIYGRVALDQYTSDNLKSPEVREVMGKVSCILDPELEKAFPKQWPATVEISTKDGRTFFTKINSPKGDYDNPLSWDELKGKFENLAVVYSKERQNQIESAVLALGNDAKGILNLIKLLAKNK